VSPTPPRVRAGARIEAETTPSATQGATGQGAVPLCRGSSLVSALLLLAAVAGIGACDDSGARPADDDAGFSVLDTAVGSVGAHDARAEADARDAGSGADARAQSAPPDTDGGTARDGGALSLPDAASSRDAGLRDGSSSEGVDSGAAPDASTTCAPPAAGSKGKNPLFSDQYSADPAPLVFNCTFYIQCGHDEAAAGQNGFVLNEWFLLSSTDMVNWTKKVALRLSAFSWANGNAWAGQMVAKNGKFYWYVPVSERGGGMAIGVAVADSPEGPFKDALGKPLINDKSEMANFGFTDPGQTVYTIDPTVFVDDDGQAYLHYGGFSRMVVMKLNDDMISINGKMQEVTPPGFFEAPYLIKRNGKYYEIYAAGVNPATIDYATSSSPMGPWTRGGRIIDALPNVAGQDAATNHAGVALFAGQWYVVYHLSNGPNGGGTYRREVAIDKLQFNADGSIQKLVRSEGLSF